MKSVDKVLITIDREIEPPVTESEGFDFLCELLEEIHNRIEAIREDAIAGESGGDETLRAPVGARTRSSTTNVRSLIGSAFRGGIGRVGAADTVSRMPVRQTFPPAARRSSM